jgi:uncharacterized membrane protein (UPF0182 family)
VIASSGERVVMSQNVDALLTALATGATEQAAAVTVAGPAAAVSPVLQPPSSGEAAAIALAHYRQALEALRMGDWQAFGVEMDALQKALEGAVTGAPPS